MTAEQGVALLTALRVQQIRIKDNGWIEGRCPLAPWLHKHRKDSTPSFGLSIAPGERSYYLCFACRQGSVEELVQSVQFYAAESAAPLDYDFATCHQLLHDELFVVPLPGYREFGPPEQSFQEWPQYWLESFQPVAWVQAATAYLTHRGVPLALWQTYDLRYDATRSMVVAPYRDVFGRLAGARGRSVVDGVSHPHHDYTFQGVNNARFCWYGEGVLNLAGPVVVVEGQFDLFRTVQAFPKTVANLTAKPTLEKMKKLGDCGVVIQIPDRDTAGQESAPRYARLCETLGLEHRVLWLDEGADDPGECHVEYLRDKIDAALNCT